VGSLLRETGGFNHPRESLNPSLHTGGSRRGRSFRRRLRRWCRWHGSRSVEMTLYVYVVASEYPTARLRRHEEASATPPRIWLRWYVKFRLFLRPGTGLYGRLAWPWFLTSPSLRQCCFCLNMLNIVTPCLFYPGRLQRPGTTPTLRPGRQAWRLRGARRRSYIFDVKSAAFFILLTSPWGH
jgi:hypothetical protein